MFFWSRRSCKPKTSAIILPYRTSHNLFSFKTKKKNKKDEKTLLFSSNLTLQLQTILFCLNLQHFGFLKSDQMILSRRMYIYTSVKRSVMILIIFWWCWSFWEMFLIQMFQGSSFLISTQQSFFLLSRVDQITEQTTLELKELKS